MSGIDYIHEDDLRLRKQIEKLERLIETAKAEAANAANLNVDLRGPISSAQKDISRLSSQVKDLEQIVEIVHRGYPYFEKDGFKSAVDACGEIAVWETLSNVSVPGVVVGHDNTEVRLPFDVQREYARALSWPFFESFVIAICFEQPDTDYLHPESATLHEPTTHYLFGIMMTPALPEKEALFLVAQW